MKWIFGLIVFVAFFILVTCNPSRPILEAPTFYHNNIPIIYEQRTNNIQSMGTQDRAGIGIIYWNEEYWSNINIPNVKWFILFHEICHLNLPTHNEGEASCCALRIMKIIWMASDREISYLADTMDVEQAIYFLECAKQL